MIAPLSALDLDAVRDLLEVACRYDRASVVAREKLFGDAPAGPSDAWGHREGGRLVGVAAATGKHLRLLAVHPDVRGRGIGFGLLDATRATRTLDLPGNYLAPGIDVRNTDTIGWFERRGWTRRDKENENLLLDARSARPPFDVDGYEIRRAGAAEKAALCDAIAAEFGGAWPFEIARALAVGGVHVAAIGSEYAAFAAHDGNNQGLGWFGPAGTWPAHRGRRLGEALLLHCLADVARDHELCEVAWIGPRPFYEKAARVVDTRRFAVLIKS